MVEEKQTSLSEQEAADEGDQDTGADTEKDTDGDESDEDEGDDDDEDDSPKHDPSRNESNGDPHQTGQKQAGVGDHKMSVPRRQATDADES